MNAADDRNADFAARCIWAERITAAQRRLDRAARKVQEANATLDAAEKEYGEASRALEALSDDPK